MLVTFQYWTICKVIQSSPLPNVWNLMPLHPQMGHGTGLRHLRGRLAMVSRASINVLRFFIVWLLLVPASSAREFRIGWV